MGVYFAAGSVWRQAHFLVAPLPERLRGGNTAAGCPRPPLSFSHYFYHAGFLLYSPLCLTFPRPHPFLPVPVCLRCALRSEHCCGAGLPPRNKAEFFPSTSLPLLLAFYSTAFLLQLSFTASVLLFSPVIYSSTPPPPLSSTHVPPCSHMPLSLLILMASLVRSKAAKRLPHRHHIRTTHRGPKHREKMALPCCVSHLAKSHTNSARQKNPNQTRNSMQLFSPTPIFWLFSSLTLFPASHSLFFSLSCSFALLTVATQHWK